METETSEAKDEKGSHIVYEWHELMLLVSQTHCKSWPWRPMSGLALEKQQKTEKVTSGMEWNGKCDDNCCPMLLHFADSNAVTDSLANCNCNATVDSSTRGHREQGTE